MLSLKSIIAGILLLIQGYWDLKQRSIPTWVSVAAGLMGMIISLAKGPIEIDLLYGFLPGMICLLVAKVTKESIGYGDGILLCALGTMYSLEETLCICTVASFGGGVAALLLLVVFRKKGSYEIPFVPFLFLGWLFLEVYSGGV